MYLSIPQQSISTSRRIFILFFLIVFSSVAYSQVRCYSFEQSNGTYSELLSPNVPNFGNGWDDPSPIQVPIGFNFSYNNANKTTCFISANGFLTFDSAADSENFQPVSSTNLYSGAICGAGGDLSHRGNQTRISYLTTGSSPNRVFTVEFRNCTRYNYSGFENNDMVTFQIKLFETSNRIQIIYGNNCNSNLASDSYPQPFQVGLRGASNSDYNIRTNSTSFQWNNSEKALTNNLSMNFRAGNVPTGGLTFTWRPAVFNNPTITSNVNQICPGSNANLSVNAESSESSVLWFEGSCGNVLFAEEFVGFNYLTHQSSIVQGTNGVLDITSSAASTPDAWINMENILSSSIVPSTFNNVAFRYRIVSGTPALAMIYFKKNGHALAEDKTVSQALINDGTWHIANFDMASNVNWSNLGGNITGWRFDYTNNQNVRMEIDYIALTDRPVLENINANESQITVNPTATTTYYAKLLAESPCLYQSGSCGAVTIYRGKTWNGGLNGNWGDPNLWIPNGVPSIDDCIMIPSSFNMAIAGSHGVGRTLNVSNGSLIVNSGNSITVRDAVTVAAGANLILENSASLVQQGTANTNSGNITMRRTAKPMKRYDFTYWSSPVAGQTLYNFSPETLRDKYYSWDINTQNWVTHLDGAQTMQAGRGYLVRAPQSFDINATQTFNSEFLGVPNSGTISLAVTGNPTADRYNLIGNPYPSAIDMDAFFTDTNNSELEQTIYLWTHNSPPNSATPGSAQYNYAASDYAVYNRSGGVATSPASDNPFDPVPSNNFNSALPTRHLAAGQAFFVKGRANGNVQFTNAMRVQGNNNNFYRTGNSNSEENDKSRFWLNLRNNEGAFNQMLVGYFEDATNEYDNGFDGELFGGNYVTVYSILNDKKLSIQGKGLPFSDEDIVPIGVVVSISGQFSLSLDSYEGLFSRQNIFLHDKTLGTYHNLKEGGYAFSMTAGTYNDRFEIVYRNGNLSTPKFSSDAIIVYQKDRKIIVDAGKTVLSGLKLLDISGRIIFEKQNINDTSAVINQLSIADQVLLINIMTPESIFTKKLIYKN